MFTMFASFCYKNFSEKEQKKFLVFPQMYMNFQTYFLAILLICLLSNRPERAKFEKTK